MLRGMAENHSKGAAIDSMTTVEARLVLRIMADNHSESAVFYSMTTVERDLQEWSRTTPRRSMDSIIVVEANLKTAMGHFDLVLDV